MSSISRRHWYKLYFLSICIIYTIDAVYWCTSFEINNVSFFAFSWKYEMSVTFVCLCYIAISHKDSEHIEQTNKQSLISDFPVFGKLLHCTF